MNPPPIPATKSTLFYDITETESQTIYRFKHTWLVYALLGVGLVIWFATLQAHILPESVFTSTRQLPASTSL